MKVMTVLGPVHSADLGIVLPHEHVFIDMRYKWTPALDSAGRAVIEDRLTIEKLGVVKRNMLAVRDNLILDSIELATAELQLFAESGGGTIVDCTVDGLGRNPVGLQLVSKASGVHIVASCGAYLCDSHPAWVRDGTVEQISARLQHELEVGIDDTGIRAGWIGELGVGQPMYGMSDEDAMAPDEQKVLRAAARAQAATGAGISVHIWNWRPNRLGLMALDILETEGAQLDRVVICHLDVRADPDTALPILDRGALVELDTFGIETYSDNHLSQHARDTERIQLLGELIGRGYCDQLLISQDVCTKAQLVAYGGWGYAHLTRNIEPRLRAFGITDSDIRRLRIETPSRLLAFVP